MRLVRVFTAIVLILMVTLPTAKAASIAEDLTTICGWYQSLTTDDQYQDFTAEDKFKFVFDPKRHIHIKYASMRMYYSALRNTEARQRYDLMQAYASGTLGKDWQCPPMKTIMQEFISLDRLFQYSQQ
ncbi:MAG: hypothetical protein LJE85_10095 [Gammaproteobacteria bacterium]|nr:hypothetical protein [Gammaproteobacteria bacterium]